MLLRSSSTPVLGSLLSETTPNHHSYEATTKHTSSSPFHCNRLLSFASLKPTTSLISCNSSPISTDFSDRDRFSCRGFRRAQSEGNLNTLAHVSDSTIEVEDPYFIDAYKPKKFTDRPKHLMLQSIPSFSRGTSEEDFDDDSTGVNAEHWLEESKEIWADREETEVKISKDEGSHFDINAQMKGLVLTREVTAKDETWIRTSFQQETEFTSQKMHLARGLGIDGTDSIKGGGCGGSGGGGEFYSGGCGGDSGDNHGNEMEEYYKNMVIENPGNPLVLRNYAQFLYQSKGDLQGAEEYYSRAILIDSKDGEILSQYAKLVWELHHDHERATAYFQLAVQASPQDSHVHAAYASFLWESEEDDNEFGIAEEMNLVPLPHLNQSYRAAATA